MGMVVEYLKRVAFEAQEYVRMTAAAVYGVFTPKRYPHDIIEQLDAIGVASLTVEIGRAHV